MHKATSATSSRSERVDLRSSVAALSVLAWCVAVAACGDLSRSASPSPISVPRDAAIDSDAGNDADAQVDAGSDVGSTGPSICERHTGALFCDDFESGDLLAWELPANTSIATDHVWNGSYAAKASTDGFISVASLQGVLSEPILAGETGYGRAHFFIPTSRSIGHFNLFAMGETNTAGGPRNDAMFSYSAISTSTFLFFEKTQTDNGTFVAPLAIPKGKHFCVEWSFEVGATGHVEVKVDGVLNTAGDGDLSLNNGGVNRVVLPIDYAEVGAQGPLDVYVDDVIVDRTPIPCSEPPHT